MVEHVKKLSDKTELINHENWRILYDFNPRSGKRRIKRIYCNHCNTYTTKQTYNMKAHFLSKHSIVKRYKCDYCPNQYFTTKNGKSQHNLRIHPQMKCLAETTKNK